MSKVKWVAVYELCFGLLGLYALAQENIVHAHRGDYDFSGIWSYFTNQSNLIVVVVALTSSLSILFWKGKTWKHQDYLRGAATLYIIITGVVYAVLLNNANPAVMFDHHVLHQVMPIAMVIGWIIHPPSARIPYVRSLWWLVYPLVYAVYALVNGAVTGTYFYAFLDPRDSGFLPVFVTIGVLILFAAFVTRILTLLPLRRKAAV
jgi:hypothetical protein